MGYEEKIQSIRFGFYGADLLGNENSRRYDVRACMQRYESLCRDALSEMYPDAEIEILFDSDLRTQVDGLSDRPEVDVVEQIRDKVHQSFRWEVPRPWLNAVNAHDRFGVPISVIRWACSEGMIREAEKQKGYWEFPQEAFLEAKAAPTFAACKEMLALKMTGDGHSELSECYSYGQLGACVTDMTAQAKLLVVLQGELERLPWFTSHNTLLLLSRSGMNLDLEVEHFVDVAQWKDIKWAYDAFAKTMISQAVRHAPVRGCLNDYQDHGRHRIDGMQFEFSFGDWQKHEVNELIRGALNTLEEMARDADIELAGGPTWVAEYEKDESRFCQEVLGPLLRQMGFLDVRYTHGSSEHGKDFTFSEMTRFGELRHYALQAKAGDVNGRVNSRVKELLGQTEDAFNNLYYVLGEDKPRHISTFVIAISGSFTEQAEEKIRSRVSRGFVGSVHFLDQQRILGLISRYWSTNR